VIKHTYSINRITSTTLLLYAVFSYRVVKSENWGAGSTYTYAGRVPIVHLHYCYH
jgi:hypothetical protein